MARRSTGRGALGRVLLALAALTCVAFVLRRSSPSMGATAFGVLVLLAGLTLATLDLTVWAGAPRA